MLKERLVTSLEIQKFRLLEDIQDLMLYMNILLSKFQMVSSLNLGDHFCVPGLQCTILLCIGVQLMDKKR